MADALPKIADPGLPAFCSCSLSFVALPSRRLRDGRQVESSSPVWMREARHDNLIWPSCNEETFCFT